MSIACIIKPHQMRGEFFLFQLFFSFKKRREKNAPISLIYMNYRSKGHDNVEMTQVGSACSKKNSSGTTATTSLQTDVVLQQQPPCKLTWQFI